MISTGNQMKALSPFRPFIPALDWLAAFLCFFPKTYHRFDLSGRRFFAGMMKAYMFWRGYYLEIFNSIVLPIPIFMVNKFSSIKRSSKVFAHYLPVFKRKDSSDANPNIAIPDIFTAFPIWAFLTRKRANIAAFSTAIFCRLSHVIMNFIFFITNKTCLLYHRHILACPYRKRQENKWKLGR